MCDGCDVAATVLDTTEGNTTMATTQDNLAWTTLDTDSLDAQSAKLYAKLKAAQAEAKAAREAFEESVRARADVPRGKRLVFGYRFGKLSAALADDDGKAKAKAPGAMSLKDMLALR